MSYNRILVTGGAGFIGSHLIDELVKEGFEVTVFVNLSTGRIENVKHHLEEGKIRFVVGDVRHSYADIKEAVKHLGFKPAVSLREGLSTLIR